MPENAGHPDAEYRQKEGLRRAVSHDRSDVHPESPGYADFLPPEDKG